jgi:hypothetical protein
LETLSLKDKENRHAQTKGIYTNRAFSSDCYCRITNGNIDAGTKPGEETG